MYHLIPNGSICVVGLIAEVDGDKISQHERYYTCEYTYEREPECYKGQIVSDVGSGPTNQLSYIRRARGAPRAYSGE